MNYKQLIDTQGYFILKNIFSEKEINDFKSDILEYTKSNKTIKNASGITIPDFIKKSSLVRVSKIKENQKINTVLHEIFGENYRFCEHNDIGINRIVGWHKDKLNGLYAKYETVDIWSEHKGEKHEIVKVLTYLEDHTNDDDGLKIVPSSHIKLKINSNGFIQLRPSLGDVIIFDQRITHRGMTRQVKNPRILVSFGFGKNNIFTDNFEKGTVIRQNKQNNIIK